MIIEIIGLPGSGKTTLTEAMKAHGAVLIPMPPRVLLVLEACLFWFLHPLLALKLLFCIVRRAPCSVRYELFMNGYLGYAARYRRAKALSRTGATAVLDQGFFQLLISLDGLPTTFLKVFPRPDLLVTVLAPASVREERMARRGWAPRGELGPEKRLLWQQDAEKAFREALPIIEQSVQAYRYDGSQDPHKGAETLLAFVEQWNTTACPLVLRGALKTFVAGISFVIAQMARLFICTPQVVVLMYHSIDNSGWKLSVMPEMFERQMQYLTRKGWAVPLADVVAYVRGEKRLPSHAVAVTFDDGYRDVLTTALPILKRYNIPATVFVPSDMSARTSPDDRPRLTEEELRVLAQSSLITIGSHAKSHHKFTELTPEEMKNESNESADKLVQITGERPNFFAYPFGACSSDAERAVKNAGYKAAFGISEGTIYQGDNLFRLRRIQIDSTMSFLLFRLRLTSAIDWNRRIVDLLRRT